MDMSISLRLMLSLVLTIAVLLTIWLPARGHEHFVAEEEWLRGLKNEAGELCCNGKDGYDAVYDTRDGSYWVLLYSKYWIVPADKVIKGPNRLGVAQVWYSTAIEQGVQTPTIRCFLPGAGI